MKVIITGAAHGIGLACAQLLAQSASHILLVDYAADALDAAAAELAGHACAIDTLVADLSLPDSARAVANKAQIFMGGCDALVSNAGAIMTMPLIDMTVEAYDRLFAINTRAAWLLAQACHPMLKRARGAIVATASLSALHPTPPHGAYSASKAALVMLMQQMANEWGPDGIRCNCVSPGMIHTSMTDPVYSDPQRKAERGRLIPLQRVGEPEDVALAIRFLISDDARYITGIDLMVNGGVHTTLMPTLRGAAVPR